jgi:hypothetical protein
MIDDMYIFDWENGANIDKFNWEISIFSPYRRFALAMINQNSSRMVYFELTD